MTIKISLEDAEVALAQYHRALEQARAEGHIAAATVTIRDENARRFVDYLVRNSVEPPNGWLAVGRTRAWRRAS